MNDRQKALKDLRDTITALRNASDRLWGGFTWINSPEGHDYWKGQAKHFSALANQLEDNQNAYLDD